MPSIESDRDELPRRRLLGASAGLLAALAGCSDQQGAPPTEQEPIDSSPESPDSPTSVPTDTDPAPNLTGPWPTAHADPANTSAVDAPGPQGEPSVRWRGYTALETGMSVATGPDGPVATREDGLVVAYDSDGGTRWRKTHSSGFVAAPVVAADGTVVVGTYAGRVVAYEADGSKRWDASTPEGLFAPHANDATPFRISGDIVVLAHPRTRTIAFDLADGSRRWEIETPPRCHRPAIADGRVFLVGPTADRNDSVVQARSLADGGVEWRKRLAQTIRIGGEVADGRLYLGSIDGELTAYDAASGDQEWQAVLPDEPWISTIPVVFAGNVWIGTLSDGLFGVSESGVQHRVEMGTGTTPVVGDGRLYVGSSEFGGSTDPEGSVVALDGEGTELWRELIPGHPHARLAYRDGHVTAASETGAVVTLNAEDGTERWHSFERPDTLPSPVVGDGAVYCVI